MRRHVSVRRFTAEPIPRTLLEQLIGCGQAASSSSFVQAYSVIRVSAPEQRRALARAAGNQRWIVEAAEFLVLCADLRRVAYCCKKSGQGELRGHTEHFITATIDTALMAQNVLLAAESVGLGGVFIGGIRNDPETVSECLQLPELVFPAFGLCLGWPDQDYPPKPRMPVQDILHEGIYREDQIEGQVDAYDATMADYYRSRPGGSKLSNWSEQTAQAIQGKTREHMLAYLRKQGFLLR